MPLYQESDLRKRTRFRKHIPGENERLVAQAAAKADPVAVRTTARVASIAGVAGLGRPSFTRHRDESHRD